MENPNASSFFQQFSETKRLRVLQPKFRAANTCMRASAF